MGKKSKLQEAIDILNVRIEGATRDICMAQAEAATMIRLRTDLEMVRDAKRSKVARKAKPALVEKVS